MAALLFAVMAPNSVDRAEAVQDPPGCTNIGLTGSISNPLAVVTHGDVVDYMVTVSNPVGNCNVTVLDLDLFLPDGSSIPVLRDANLGNGESISCPGGPGCMGLASDYSHTVAHVDENGGSSGCPPTLTPGNTRITAYARGAGIGHGIIDDAATVCQVRSNPVFHPDFEITKECSPDPVDVGDTITWTVTVENTGDATLDIDVEDLTAGISETITLAPGASQTIVRSRTVTGGDAPAISNTVTATGTPDPALGLDDVIEKTAQDSCAVGTPTPSPTPSPTPTPTPTPSPTPTPVPTQPPFVGGIVDLHGGSPDLSASDAGSASRSFIVLGGVVAAALAVVVAGAWYARRRAL